MKDPSGRIVLHSKLFVHFKDMKVKTRFENEILFLKHIGSHPNI